MLAPLVVSAVPAKVALNRVVVEHDVALVIGPVFPHEVVGFSGGNKYFFPGIAGQEIIDLTHWVGALITSSLLTAESLGVALSVRGYGAHRTMTVMHDVVRRPQEVALSILVLALGVCAVAGRLAWGWGRL